MKKAMLFSLKNGKREFVELTFEEFFLRVEKMIADFTHKLLRKFPTDTRNNICLEFDDVFQEMSLASWKAYNTYDLSKGCVITTHLEWMMKQRSADMIKGICAEKRVGDFNKKSMSVPVCTSDKGNKELYVEDIIPYNEIGFNGLEQKEIMNFLGEQAKDRRDRLMVAHMLEPNNYPVAKLAEDLGMYRTSLYKNIKKFRTRISNEYTRRFLQ